QIIDAPLAVFEDELAMAPANIGKAKTQVGVRMPADGGDRRHDFDLQRLLLDRKAQRREARGQQPVRSLAGVPRVADDRSFLGHGPLPRRESVLLESAAI